jgi:tripartite-type tricarboxylate transporter receptor subunit TctC
MRKWNRFLNLLAAGAFAVCAGNALAQSGPMRIVAPFPPGGITDLLARSLSQELAKNLGQTVVVENRAGAGGNIGADLVAKSPPNGQVLLMSSASPLAINEFLYAQMPFDPATAFAPVAKLADMPQILVVHPSRAATLAELLQKAKAQPEGLKIGSAGPGSVAHLALELFMQTAGVRIVHVPYKGAGPALQDALGGQIDGNFTNPPTAVPQVQGGKLRALGVAGRKRLSALPDVPTFAEAGVNFEASAWFGILVPAGTPEPTVRRLNEAIVKVLREPELQQRFAALGAELAPGTPQEFDQLIRAERAKWGAIVRAGRIKAD